MFDGDRNTPIKEFTESRVAGLLDMCRTQGEEVDAQALKLGTVIGLAMAWSMDLEVADEGDGDEDAQRRLQEIFDVVEPKEKGGSETEVRLGVVTGLLMAWDRDLQAASEAKARPSGPRITWVTQRLEGIEDLVPVTLCVWCQEPPQFDAKPDHSYVHVCHADKKVYHETAASVREVVVVWNKTNLERGRQ